MRSGFDQFTKCGASVCDQLISRMSASVLSQTSMLLLSKLHNAHCEARASDMSASYSAVS
jgi:hypothetical protein